MNAIKIIGQWGFLILVGFGIYWLFHHYSAPVLPTMPGYQALFFALAIAFTWVEVLKWGVTKPFNCVKCMTAWVALILAVVFHTTFWYLYLPAGLFVGAIYSAIKLRWL